MRAKQGALAITALGLLGLLTACDQFIDYTVVNETQQELITWPLLDHCDELVGHNGDYLHQDVVKPGETHDYLEITGGVEVECVQVATTDRRVVLSEPYEYGGTYTVREPLQPLTTPVPKEKDLPREPFIETFTGSPILTSFMLAVAVGTSAAVMGGTFVGTRFLYRRFRAQHTAIRGGVLAIGGLISVAIWLAGAWWWLRLFWVDMPP